MIARRFTRGIDEINAGKNKGDAQKLPHIQRQALFEGHLVFLDEFNQEAGEETDRQGRAEESSGKLNDSGPPVGPVQRGEHDEVGGGLVEHRRVARDIVDAGERPRPVGKCLK